MSLRSLTSITACSRRRACRTNGNVSAVAFDIFALPVAMAQMGKVDPGPPELSETKAEPDPDAARKTIRWIANGKTIVNNKGKPVLQYEPYFSANGHRFEELQAAGVSPIMYYDAPGRLVRTEFPDGSLSRVEFSPWFSRSFDQNDTVLEPGNRWYAEHTAAGAAQEEKRAARLAALHAGTPAGTPSETTSTAWAARSSPSRATASPTKPPRRRPRPRSRTGRGRKSVISPSPSSTPKASRCGSAMRAATW